MYKNKTYLYLVMSLATIYFLTTNIQFWMSDYLVTIDKIPYDTVVIAFTTICITAPTFGSVLGGYIGKKVNGYESVYCLPICIIGSILIIGASAPICFINNSTLKFSLIWL
jgi:sugar phosphate permease